MLYDDHFGLKLISGTFLILAILKKYEVAGCCVFVESNKWKNIKVMNT